MRAEAIMIGHHDERLRLAENSALTWW